MMGDSSSANDRTDRIISRKDATDSEVRPTGRNERSTFNSQPFTPVSKERIDERSGGGGGQEGQHADDSQHEYDRQHPLDFVLFDEQPELGEQANLLFLRELFEGLLRLVRFRF